MTDCSVLEQVSLVGCRITTLFFDCELPDSIQWIRIQIGQKLQDIYTVDQYSQINNFRPPSKYPSLIRTTNITSQVGRY